MATGRPSCFLVAAMATVTVMTGCGRATEPARVNAKTEQNLQSVIEMEDFVYLQIPPEKSQFKDAIVVVWIPGPAIKYCLGKTMRQCTELEYCFRVAQKHNAEPEMCKAIHDLVAAMPPYPADVIPRRVTSCTYLPAARDMIKGVDALFAFRQSKPRGYFDRISSRVRFRARLKLKRRPDEYELEDLEMVEVLGTPGQ